MKDSIIKWKSKDKKPKLFENVLIMLEYPNKKYSGCTVGYVDEEGWKDFLRNSTPLGDYHTPSLIMESVVS